MFLVRLVMIASFAAASTGAAAEAAEAPNAMGSAEALPLGAKCMTRSHKDAQGTDHALTIVVPDAALGRFAGKGFTASPCNSMTVTEYRTRACRLAAQGNEAVQKRLEQVLGASPKELCSAVKAVAPFPRTEEIMPVS